MFRWLFRSCLSVHLVACSLLSVGHDSRSTISVLFVLFCYSFLSLAFVSVSFLFHFVVFFFFCFFLSFSFLVFLLVSFLCSVWFIFFCSLFLIDLSISSVIRFAAICKLICHSTVMMLVYLFPSHSPSCVDLFVCLFRCCSLPVTALPMSLRYCIYRLCICLFFLCLCCFSSLLICSFHVSAMTLLLSLFFFSLFVLVLFI